MTNPPVIILVRPQLGQNIGMVARAMLNFGLGTLRLVEPRDGWPNPDAGPAAAGADTVIDAAGVYPTLEAALADCHRSFAATVRPRGLSKDVVSPAQAARAMRRLAGDGARTALVFGPERSGLTTEDVTLCDVILTIPTNPDFSSLNLAMAVTVAAYAWSVGDMGAAPAAGDDRAAAPADHAEVQGLIDHLDADLTARDYFYPPDRAATMRRTVAAILRRPGFSPQDVRTLRGIVRALAAPPRRS